MDPNPASRTADNDFTRPCFVVRTAWFVRRGQTFASYPSPAARSHLDPAIGPHSSHVAFVCLTTYARPISGVNDRQPAIGLRPDLTTLSRSAADRLPTLW